MKTKQTAETTPQTFDTFQIVFTKIGGTQVLFLQLSKWKSCKKSHKIFWGLLLEKSKKTALAHTQSCSLLNHSTKGSIAQQSLHRGQGGGVRSEGWGEAFFFRALKVSMQSYSGALTHGLFHFSKKKREKPCKMIQARRSQLTNCSPVISKGREFKLPPIECQTKRH